MGRREKVEEGLRDCSASTSGHHKLVSYEAPERA